MSLIEGSKSYYSQANIYDKFSNAEDKPGKVLKFLKKEVKNKTVLDLGCGTGKYLSMLSKSCKKYYGIDISKEELRIAESKKSDNTELIHASADKIPLPNESIDIVFCTWVMGSIKNYRTKKKALDEIDRVLKTKGIVYLVENDIGEEFEKIRGRYPNIKRTKTYNNWIIGKGFKIVKKISTFFGFKSKQEAYNIFNSIWGLKIANKITSSKINHKIIILKRVKYF